MADREKLIELLGANTCKHDYCEDCEYCENRDACIAFLKESMADHLIANGVTIQKWIPVMERLPEAFLAVLAYCPNGGNIYEVYLNARSEWHFFDETVAGAVLQNAVTHWMPLPEPPKGE